MPIFPPYAVLRIQFPWDWSDWWRTWRQSYQWLNLQRARDQSKSFALFWVYSWQPCASWLGKGPRKRGSQSQARVSHRLNYSGPSARPIGPYWLHGWSEYSQYLVKTWACITSSQPFGVRVCRWIRNTHDCLNWGCSLLRFHNLY